MSEPPDMARGRLSIRAAAMKDCRKAWEWRNARAARAASFTTREIPYEEHQVWFARALVDPRLQFFIVLHDRRPVGYVRFVIKGENAEISVGIDPQEQGNGYGTTAIALASGLMLAKPVRRIVAHVKTGNPASRRAFERAGFSLHGIMQIAGTEAWELIFDGQSEPAHEPSPATV